jgi:hypothetical protein
MYADLVHEATDTARATALMTIRAPHALKEAHDLLQSGLNRLSLLASRLRRPLRFHGRQVLAEYDLEFLRVIGQRTSHLQQAVGRLTGPSYCFRFQNHRTVTKTIKTPSTAVT